MLTSRFDKVFVNFIGHQLTIVNDNNYSAYKPFVSEKLGVCLKTWSHQYVEETTKNYLMALNFGIYFDASDIWKRLCAIFLRSLSLWR